MLRMAVSRFLWYALSFEAPEGVSKWPLNDLAGTYESLYSSCLPRQAKLDYRVAPSPFKMLSFELLGDIIKC